MLRESEMIKLAQQEEYNDDQDDDYYNDDDLIIDSSTTTNSSLTGGNGQSGSAGQSYRNNQDFNGICRYFFSYLTLNV
jgi:hypothetical protein